MSGIGMCTATLIADPLAASTAEVREAIEAAVAAGCPDLSVWAHQLAGVGDVSGVGARVVALEAALAWAGPDAAAAAAEAARLAEAAAGHGASLVLAATMEPVLPDRERARDGLGALAEAVGGAGATVALEFLPWSAVPSLAAAWELVAPLDGVGVLIDSWHWQRQPGGPCPEVLAEIPGSRIPYVQVCDAAATPASDVLTEAMTARMLPGEGVVDFAGLFAVLEGCGARPFVATEIFNPALVGERGRAGAAGAMIAAARRVVPAAWSGG